MGALTLEQLGKYEAHYVKKNDGIGALESLLGGIDNNNEIKEIRSIAYSMYEEFHSDQKKRIIRNITIVSTVTMSAAFSVFLLIRHLNPIVDIKLPIEVVSLTLAATCLLMLCYQLIKYEIIEYKLNNRCFDEQDESKTNMIQANDSNDIVTLRTRLKRLTDCVKPNYMNSCCYSNPQAVMDEEKPIPKAPPMLNHNEELQGQTNLSLLNEIKQKQLERVNAVKNSCSDKLPDVNNSQQSFKRADNYVDEIQSFPLYKKQREIVDQQNQQVGYANPYVDNDSFLLPPPPPLLESPREKNPSIWADSMKQSLPNSHPSR